MKNNPGPSQQSLPGAPSEKTTSSPRRIEILSEDEDSDVEKLRQQVLAMQQEPPQTQPKDARDTAQNAEDFLNQGLNKAKQGDYRGASTDFNQALQINPNNAQAYHNRGIAGFKLGETQGAIENFTQALRLNPDYAEAYVGRGNAYRKLGDNQGAIIDYSQLTRLNPNNAKAYYNRGVAYSELGDKQRAIEDYQKAVKLFYEQGDEVNCKRAADNLSKLQPPTPPKSAVNANNPFKPS